MDKHANITSNISPNLPPVITIDGPTASGKGTIARRLAAHLGWHWLDSGALYRLTAIAAQDANLLDDIEQNIEQIAKLARYLDIRFGMDVQGQEQIFLNDVEVSARLRAETTGALASKISGAPAVRAALLDLQRSFRRAPGLVTDGRDMGTVVFPDASVKFFLEASAQVRAERRLKQLASLGIHARLDDLLSDIAARDARDRERAVAPLKPAADAVILDSSEMDVEAVLSCVLALFNR